MINYFYSTQIITWNINYNVDFGIRSKEYAGMEEEAFQEIYAPHQHKYDKTTMRKTLGQRSCFFSTGRAACCCPFFSDPRAAAL